jgi:hypothetical protein
LLKKECLRIFIGDHFAATAAVLLLQAAWLKKLTVEMGGRESKKKRIRWMTTWLQWLKDSHQRSINRSKLFTN